MALWNEIRTFRCQRREPPEGRARRRVQLDASGIRQRSGQSIGSGAPERGRRRHRGAGVTDRPAPLGASNAYTYTALTTEVGGELEESAVGAHVRVDTPQREWLDDVGEERSAGAMPLVALDLAGLVTVKMYSTPEASTPYVYGRGAWTTPVRRRGYNEPSVAARRRTPLSASTSYSTDPRPSTSARKYQKAREARLRVQAERHLGSYIRSPSTSSAPAARST